MSICLSGQVKMTKEHVNNPKSGKQSEENYRSGVNSVAILVYYYNFLLFVFVFVILELHFEIN